MRGCVGQGPWWPGRWMALGTHFQSPHLHLGGPPTGHMRRARPGAATLRRHAGLPAGHARRQNRTYSVVWVLLVGRPRSCGSQRPRALRAFCACFCCIGQPVCLGVIWHRTSLAPHPSNGGRCGAAVGLPRTASFCPLPYIYPPHRRGVRRPAHSRPGDRRCLTLPALFMRQSCAHRPMPRPHGRSACGAASRQRPGGGGCGILGWCHRRAK